MGPEHLLSVFREEEILLEAVSNSPEETMLAAKAVGELLLPGDLLNLNGELGAGKTLFVKGVAQALGIPAEVVTSPTFSILNEYEGEGGLLYHFDFYRLEDELELENTGYQDYFYGSGITVVEWGNLFEAHLPGERVDITLEKTSTQGRKLIFAGRGQRGREIMERLRGLSGVRLRD